MTIISIAVLVVFTFCVAGLGLMLVRISRGREADDQDDDAWIAELRALNAAMPHIRRHRARVAARAARHRP